MNKNNIEKHQEASTSTHQTPAGEKAYKKSLYDIMMKIRDKNAVDSASLNHEIKNFIDKFSLGQLIYSTYIYNSKVKVWFLEAALQYQRYDVILVCFQKGLKLTTLIKSDSACSVGEIILHAQTVMKSIKELSDYINLMVYISLNVSESTSFVYRSVHLMIAEMNKKDYASLLETQRQVCALWVSFLYNVANLNVLFSPDNQTLDVSHNYTVTLALHHLVKIVGIFEDKIHHPGPGEKDTLSWLTQQHGVVLGMVNVTFSYLFARRIINNYHGSELVRNLQFHKDSIVAQNPYKLYLSSGKSALIDKIHEYVLLEAPTDAQKKAHIEVIKKLIELCVRDLRKSNNPFFNKDDNLSKFTDKIKNSVDDLEKYVLRGAQDKDLTLFMFPDRMKKLPERTTRKPDAYKKITTRFIALS